MDLIFFDRASPLYPCGLREWPGGGAPPFITVAGSLDLLNLRTLGLLCSVKCPGDVIVKTYDLARALRDAGIPIIGGFHSPMEKECLRLLLRGSQPVLICLARSLDEMRLRSEWKQPLAEGRLLLLSCFGSKHRRVTAQRAQLRNRYLVALADQVLVAHAAQGSQTERLCRELTGRRKPLWTIDSAHNDHLAALGAKLLTMDRISEVLGTA